MLTTATEMHCPSIKWQPNARIIACMHQQQHRKQQKPMNVVHGDFYGIGVQNMNFSPIYLVKIF